MLNICLVGCGAIVMNSHLPALRRLRDTWRVAWLVDPEDKARMRLAKREACGHSADINDIPDNMDACLVAVPNHLHSDISSRLLARGFDVLCEKPMADTLAASEHVERTVRNGMRFAMVHQMRFDPTIKLLQTLLSRNIVGNIRSVDFAFGNPFGWISRTNFYRFEPMAGGGVLMDLGCHLVDLCLFLFGPPHLERAAILYECGSRRMDLSATLEITLSDGIVGTIRTSRIATLSNSVTITGDRGVAVAKLGEGEVRVTGHRSERFNAEAKDPFVELWRAFAAGDSCLSGSSDGRIVMEILDRAYRVAERLEEADD